MILKSGKQSERFTCQILLCNSWGNSISDGEGELRKSRREDEMDFPGWQVLKSFSSHQIRTQRWCEPLFSCREKREWEETLKYGAVHWLHFWFLKFLWGFHCGRRCLRTNSADVSYSHRREKGEKEGTDRESSEESKRRRMKGKGLLVRTAGQNWIRSAFRASIGLTAYAYSCFSHREQTDRQPA